MSGRLNAVSNPERTAKEPAIRAVEASTRAADEAAVSPLSLIALSGRRLAGRLSAPVSVCGRG